MKNYTGGCHCGQVRYVVKMELEGVISCNCSICQKKGHLLAFVKEEQFKLEQGESSLTDYQFHTKKIHHLFCKHCGISSFGRGSDPSGNEMYAINVRCLEGVDIEGLKVTPVDGRSF